MNILEQLKQLEADATPGPWYSTISRYGISAEELLNLLQENVWTVGPYSDRENWETDSNCSGYGMPSSDAAFLCALRNAWPKLLAVVEAASDGAITWDLDSASVYGEKRIFAARYKLEVALDALKEDE